MGKLADWFLGMKHYYNDSFFGKFEARYRLKSVSRKRIWVASFNMLPEYKDVAVYLNGDNTGPSQNLLREIERIFLELNEVKFYANRYFLESADDDHIRGFKEIGDWQKDFILKSIENHGESEYLLEFVSGVEDETALLGFLWSKNGVSSGYFDLGE